MHKHLFIPGPVEVTGEVLEKMATPMIGHRTEEATALQRRIAEKVQTLFCTENEVLLSTSSGSGLMEGAVRSCTTKQAVVFSCGAFGDRWFEMAEANGVPAHRVAVEWGQGVTPELVAETLSTGEYDLVTITHNETSTGVMNPLEGIAEILADHPDIVWCVDAVSSAGGIEIPVDALGIDILITSTQKALGLPPGLSLCTISKRALERAEKVENRGFYLDLLRLYEYVQKKPHQYPSTPALSQMFALDYQLDRILDEGPERRYARHRQLKEITRDWAERYFTPFVSAEYASQTVTTITNTRDADIGMLNRELGSRGYMISNGYGQLKDKTFRIAHMAETTADELKELLAAIEDILNL